MKFSSLILFFLVLSGAGNELQKAQPSPIHQSQTAAEGQENNQTSGQESTGAQKSKTKETTGHTYNYNGAYNYYSSESSNWPIWITAIATVAIAIFAAGQIWFLWGAMTATQGAASAANKNADAARSVAETASRQTEIMANRDRAWIMVKPDGEPKEDPARLPFGYEVEWSAINVGGTPAFLTELLVEVDIISMPIPNSRPDCSASKPFAKFIIPPNGRHSSKSGKTFSPTVQGTYFRGESCVVLYGLVKYQDAISDHITRFCCYWYIRDNSAFFEPVGPPDWVEYT